MAKHKRALRAKKASTPKHIVGTHTYAGKTFGCYGKHVRTGKGTKKSARMYCGNKANQ